MHSRRFLIAYIVANAVLYSCLMPLWEGFDEAFHFGYVQQLTSGRLSDEVKASLLLAPFSPVVQRNLPSVTSFSEYFSWPPEKRVEAKRQLYAIPSSLRLRVSDYGNYETQQAPLVYVLMAPLERMLAALPLPERVLVLRLIAALAGCFLLLFAADALFGQLAVPGAYRDAALFCVFSCQMLWATVAHVANDWLAIPLAVWTLVALLRFQEKPDNRTAVIAAAVFAVGLVTKAYFLALIPLVGVVFVVRGRHVWVVCAVAGILAGPWYARNLVLYGSLSGTQESRAGFGFAAALKGAGMVLWRAVIPAYIHSALWTGNNNFLAFSAGTLNLLIAAGLLALMRWAARRHSRAEWMVVGYCACFVMAIAYASIITNITFHGVALTAEPWYAQVLAAPVLGLVWLGAGRYLGAALVAVMGYIMAATYLVKLIPLYGGYEGRGSIAALSNLYGRGLGGLMSNLNSVALAPAGLVLSLAGVVAVLTIVQQVKLIGRMR